MVILLHNPYGHYWTVDDDDGGEEEERRLIDLWLASLQVKTKKIKSI